MSKVYQLLLLCFVFLISSISFAQKGKQQYFIHFSKAEFTVDGKMDEPDWQNAEVASSFICNFPFDTIMAHSKTEVRMLYTSKSVFLFAKMYDNSSKEYVIQSLKRDFSYPVSDAFSLILDPLNDKQNGFSFAVNPYGAQREGLIANGGGQGVSTDWDNVWYSDTKTENGYWTAEFEIPLKTLRFKDNVNAWGINFTRNDLKINESSTWVKVPRVFNVATLAFTGELIFDEAPKRSQKTKITFIPYVISSFIKNYTKNSTPLSINGGGNPNVVGNFGLDGKIPVSSSLNCDITLNPDFAQVEVDRQVTNLTRFDILFPERRNFFIENSDLFSSFGFQQIRPFFSRQIGLFNDKIIPIQAGARLSGKVNKDWRIGVMNMQTALSTINQQDPANYTMAAVQRKVFARSNISAFVSNKSFTSNNFNLEKNNTTVGADYNIYSANNKYQGKLFYHYNFNSISSQKSYAHASWLFYSTNTINWMWNHEYVGKNYRPATGAVPRIKQVEAVTRNVFYNSYWRIEPIVFYWINQKSSIINRHGPRLYVDYYCNDSLLTTDLLVKPSYQIEFQNSAFVSFDFNHNYVHLLYKSDITSKNNILEVGKYNFNTFSCNFNTNKRRQFIFNGSINIGNFYNASRESYSFEISKRVQPFAIFSISTSYDKLIFNNESSNSAFLTLITAKAEFSFTKSIFFTSFLQYNTQRNNFNINSRLQWRFKPMSDLFIVYTDNYNTLNPNQINNNFYLGIINRALVVKLVWWI
jgi:hypothetical protein